MFKLASNCEIGAYLREKITGKYKSVRQFGKAYLEHKGEAAGEYEVQKMSNRLSQIIKGEKSIQLCDLPGFTALLEISCEEILSAGQSFAPRADRATNYTVALSEDEGEWLRYMDRKDTPILNPDEYRKTVIDYAIEFKNYSFLKFLVENNYIWFDSGKDEEYIMTFGAGTKIQRRAPERFEGHLEYKIRTEDQLRINIIRLAIEKGDIQMLGRLRARELPELYYKAHYLSCAHPDFDRRYDETFVRCISKASEKIVDYFTDEFPIRDAVRYKDGSKREHIFMFPFISKLLSFLIAENHPFAADALNKAIEHNKKTYRILQQLIAQRVTKDFERYGIEEETCAEDVKLDLIKRAVRDFDYYENGDIVSFRDPYNSTGIITNIARAEVERGDIKLNGLVEKLNTLFEKITKIKDEFTEEGIEECVNRSGI